MFSNLSPCPLPLLREGGVGKRGASPLSKISSPSCKEDIPITERGIKGVRLINNLECEVCYDLLGELFDEEKQQLPDFINNFRGIENKVAMVGV